MIVRVGPNAVARLLVYAGELRDLLYPWLVEDGAIVGDFVYDIVVHHRAPDEFERKATEIEAKGDGFVFRFDLEYRSARAFLWGDIPGWQVACPLRQIFSWIVAHAGGVLLHAGAHAIGDGAVVFAGESGSGKSTLAAHFVNRDAHGFMGDDWVIVYPHGKSWGVRSLYKSLKLYPEAPGRDHTKPIAFVHKGKYVWQMETLRASSRVKLLALPRTCTERYNIAAVKERPFEAVRRVAPSTLLQSGGVPPSTLRIIRDFAEAVPCYDLMIGKSWLPHMPGIIEKIVE